MQIQFTAAPDPALITAAVRRGLRRPVMIARGAGWAVLLVAAFLLVTTDNLSPALLAIGAGLAVGVPFVLVNHVMRRAVRRGRVTTYEISDAGLATAGLTTGQIDEILDLATARGLTVDRIRTSAMSGN